MFNPPKMEGPFSAGGLNKLEPEFEPAFTAWKKTPNNATRTALLHAVDPVISKAIHSYGGGSTGSPVLKSRAKMLALEAMNTYDPMKSKLNTHLLSSMQRLHRISAQQQQIIKVPERVISDRKLLSEAEHELMDQLGRDPSDMEIADFTGFSLKRLGHIRQAHVPVSEGSVLAGQQGEEEDGFMPASVIPGHDPGEAAWQDFVYADLAPKDRVIMDYSLGLHGTPRSSAVEIARRLGLSPGAVSQRAAKIQAMLDERKRYNLL